MRQSSNQYITHVLMLSNHRGEKADAYLRNRCCRFIAGRFEIQHEKVVEILLRKLHRFCRGYGLFIHVQMEAFLKNDVGPVERFHTAKGSTESVTKRVLVTGRGAMGRIRAPSRRLRLSFAGIIGEGGNAAMAGGNDGWCTMRQTTDRQSTKAA